MTVLRSNPDPVVIRHTFNAGVGFRGRVHLAYAVSVGQFTFSDLVADFGTSSFFPALRMFPAGHLHFDPLPSPFTLAHFKFTRVRVIIPYFTEL